MCLFMFQCYSKICFDKILCVVVVLGTRASDQLLRDGSGQHGVCSRPVQWLEGGETFSGLILNSKGKLTTLLMFSHNYMNVKESVCASCLFLQVRKVVLETMKNIHPIYNIKVHRRLFNIIKYLM